MIRAVLLAAALALSGPVSTGAGEDAQGCLARTVYWEARGQPEAGRLAVAHVVLNRARSRAFPGSVCGVVRQGGEAPPCQFNWRCDGRPDAPRDAAAWRRAQEIALRALSGAEADPSRGATLFHRRGVSPGWARPSWRTAEIGDHLFYRAPGH